jgi:protocatechuate 3,4-dioxygenase beta subunit
MSSSRLARRSLIHGSLALAGTSWLLGSQGTAAATLPPTPQQTPGPFYPFSFPQDSDNDLIHVSGHSGPAKGIVTRITGRILDPNGRPI